MIELDLPQSGVQGIEQRTCGKTGLGENYLANCELQIIYFEIDKGKINGLLVQDKLV